LLPRFIFPNIRSENPAAAVEESFLLTPNMLVKPVRMMKAKAASAIRTW
jgi:hypothetical protein